jgi:hypothetical protein
VKRLLLVVPAMRSGTGADGWTALSIRTNRAYRAQPS